ncbi:uncharacterized protein LOC134253856 [Saccostrea cucullata]|uniref:uncharacterized protein LOC134253856 n=1 Tax=Saccostrea cuccullata TaxID=36930 RepID=UPI002ED27964
MYADANNACLLESAELIRMDSVEKYNVLKKLIELTADISTAEAWIQGKKSNGIWEFHDGTQFPDFFCPTILTNGPRENRIRLKASDNFNCHDTHHDYKYGFVCEFFVNN